MYSGEEQKIIRAAMFDWLREQSVLRPWFSRKELREDFVWRGRVIPLIDLQKGIWNPKEFESTVSITTMLESPYSDEEQDNGDLSYAYQASPTGQGTNTKLRNAFTSQTPLIHFQEIERGKYIASPGVFVTEDIPDAQTFIVNLSGAASKAQSILPEDPLEKSYVERVVRQRVHQPKFRARVIFAYETKCSICQLNHKELLDAAHILPDKHILGSASVTNGLALCKIHHAAYDTDIIGITADYKVRVNDEILLEVDGPMLKHGIQEMHGASIRVPSEATKQPSRDFLAERFDQFLKKSA